MRHHLFVLSALLLSTGCGSNGDASRLDISPAQADRQTDDQASSDGGTPSADARADLASHVSLIGNWAETVQTGPTFVEHLLALSGAPTGGALVFEMRHRDGYGAEINCLTINRAEGTWTANGSVLDIELNTGRTQRKQDPAANLSCNAAQIYEERDMTEQELQALDFFSGPYTVAGNELQVQTLSGHTLVFDRVQ